MLEVKLGSRVWDRVEIFGSIKCFFFLILFKQLRRREGRDGEKDGMLKCWSGKGDGGTRRKMETNQSVHLSK